MGDFGASRALEARAGVLRSATADLDSTDLHDLDRLLGALLGRTTLSLVNSYLRPQGLVPAGRPWTEVGRSRR